MEGAFFDYKSMLVHVPITLEGYDAAKRFWAAPQAEAIGHQVPDAAKWNHLRTLSILEHEFAHARTLLSTPLGYMLYLAVRTLNEARAKCLQTLPELRYNHFRTMMVPHSHAFDLLRSQRIDNVNRMASLAWCARWIAGLRLLHRFTVSNLSEYNERSRPFRSVMLNWDLQNDATLEGRLPLLTTPVFSQHTNHVAHSGTLSLVELLEGAAMWKEFAKLSEILWLQASRRDFSRYTERWLTQTTRSERYTKAADLILAATGCNLTRALPAVLLDIALTPPLFAWERLDWSEVHPCLRFAEILRVAGRLPPHLKEPRNNDILSSDYYVEVETRLRRMLGWRSVRCNLELGSRAVLRHRGYSRDRWHPKRPDPVPWYLGLYFLNAFEWRKEDPGVMWFPGPQSRNVRVHSEVCPPLAVFGDDPLLHFRNDPGGGPGHAVSFVWQTITLLFLESIFYRDSRGSGESWARWLFSLVPGMVPPEWHSCYEVDPEESFEEFIEHSIGRLVEQGLAGPGSNGEKDGQ